MEGGGMIFGSGGQGAAKLGQIASGTSQVQKENIDCFFFKKTSADIPRL